MLHEVLPAVEAWALRGLGGTGLEEHRRAWCDNLLQIFVHQIIALQQVARKRRLLIGGWPVIGENAPNEPARPHVRVVRA